MSEVDPGVATAARIYSYMLGGKDHFPADREAAEKALEAMPEARDFALVNRAFLTRVVHHLASAGITQFLDVGIGLPAPGGTAETALKVNPTRGSSASTSTRWSWPTLARTRTTR
ncbi:hypothetical protein ABH935_005958 [Catenulispora sp. GAS73]